MGDNTCQRVSDHIRAHLLRQVNLEPSGSCRQTWEEAYSAEWDPAFSHACRQRLVMGLFRYGPINRKTELNYQRINDAMRRLSLYRETGNVELLMDVANLAMLEFRHGTHPQRHFHPSDDGQHVPKGEPT